MIATRREGQRLVMHSTGPEPVQVRLLLSTGNYVPGPEGQWVGPNRTGWVVQLHPNLGYAVEVLRNGTWTEVAG